MPLPRSSSRIQPATLSRKYRSCVTATTVPWWSARKRSSQKTDSASRWFVGSSRSSRSGAESSSRQSATRRGPPPARVGPPAAGGGGRGRGGRRGERVHRVLDVRVEAPRVGGVDLRLQARELVGRVVGVVGGELVEAVEQRARAGDAVLDVAAHVLRLVEVRLLLEQAHLRVGREHRVAA